MQEEPRELEVGQRVFVVGDHCWAGNAGVIIDVGCHYADRHFDAEIRLDDDGETCFANRRNLQVLSA